MKFYTGSEANAQSYLDGIYLATDTHKLFYKGSPYGGDPYVELDWIQDFKSGSGTMEEAAFNKLKDAVDNYKLLVVNCTGAAHSTRVCTPEIGDDGSYICKFTDINNYENAEEYILAVKIASVNPSTRAITMLHDTTYPLDIDLSNYYTIAQVDGKIGTNVYTGANYISKETNLTDAVLQLDEEIKATNDNLALEHTNAEATYAKKTELRNYLPLSGGTLKKDSMIYFKHNLASNDPQLTLGTSYISLSSKVDYPGISTYLGMRVSASANSGVLFETRSQNGYLGKNGVIGIFLEKDSSGEATFNPYFAIGKIITPTESQIHGGFPYIIIRKTGISLYNKTSNDLLNAAGGTVSIQDIISQVTVPTKVSQLSNDSGYQTESQVAAKVASLVDSAPETLDTLNELAAALGDDPNFATTVTNQIASKQDKLVSGTNIKTINGQTLLGSGDITTPTPTVNAASGTKTIWTGTSSEYEAVSPKDANTLYFITEE